MEMKRTYIIALILLALMVSGCIMPIPHRRLHAYGVRGTVVDAGSHQPIPTAVVARGTDLQESVVCNAAGGFEIQPLYGWHGAYFIGPISLSLFPGFDIAAPIATVSVSAPGYKTHTFPSYDEEYLLMPSSNRNTRVHTEVENDWKFIDLGQLKLERETKDK